MSADDGQTKKRTSKKQGHDGANKPSRKLTQTPSADKGKDRKNKGICYLFLCQTFALFA